jgi:hypothetical protein
MVITLGIASLLLLLRRKPIWACVIQVIALLVHENAFLVVYPMFLFGFYQAMKLDYANNNRLWLAALLPALLFVGIVTWHDQFMAKDVPDKQIEYLSQFGFINSGLKSPVPLYLGMSFADYVAFHSKIILHILSIPKNLLIAMPFLLATACHFVMTPNRRMTALELIFMLGAVLAPQGIHFAAWDTARIWTYSIVTAFAMLWMQAERYRDSGSSLLAIGLCAAALILYALTDLALMRDMEHFSRGVRVLLYMPALVAIAMLMRFVYRQRLQHTSAVSA